MLPIELKDPAAFGTEFLRLTLLQGFQSLTKRDLELLIFILLERDGAIARRTRPVSMCSGSGTWQSTPWIAGSSLSVAISASTSASCVSAVL